MKRFSVIGAGNVGVNLINSLIHAGYNFKYIYKKTKYDYYISHLSNDIGLIVNESDFIFLSTQESEIAGAADVIAREADPSGKFIFHTCNFLTSDFLSSIKEKGGMTASFSPLQTFVDFVPGSNLFSGIYFLAEGDKRALILAEEIAKNIGANILSVSKEEKKYIHIAAVASSNFLISILKFAQNQLKKCRACDYPPPIKIAPGKKPGNNLAGYDLKIMFPLIKQTLKNVAEKGVEASLSGPLKRKEFAILKTHLALLEQDEAVYYKILTEYLKK